MEVQAADQTAGRQRRTDTAVLQRRRRRSRSPGHLHALGQLDRRTGVGGGSADDLEHQPLRANHREVVNELVLAEFVNGPGSEWRLERIDHPEAEELGVIAGSTWADQPIAPPLSRSSHPSWCSNLSHRQPTGAQLVAATTSIRLISTPPGSELPFKMTRHPEPALGGEAGLTERAEVTWGAAHEIPGEGRGPWKRPGAEIGSAVDALDDGKGVLDGRHRCDVERHPR
jgi:hypothetical protein